MAFPHRGTSAVAFLPQVVWRGTGICANRQRSPSRLPRHPNPATTGWMSG